MDPEVEYVELASNQIRYQALRDSVNQEFALLKAAMKLKIHILPLIARCILIGNVVADQLIPIPRCIHGFVQYIHIIKNT